MAAYLQASLDITDNLQFTAGLRYTEETREATLDITKADAAAIGAPAFIPASALGKAGRPAPSERMTLGCIGTGNNGINTTAGLPSGRTGSAIRDLPGSQKPVIRNV